MMTDKLDSPQKTGRSWVRRFANAGRGIGIAMRGEASFYVHWFVTVLVAVTAIMLKISPTSWCLLTLCVAMVMTAETINTAMEHLARAISHEENSEIRDALDIASAAVLVASIGAAAVGLVVLGLPMLKWWAAG